MNFDPKSINFSKLNGLVPAVIQDSQTQAVLMVGFMNEDALAKTVADEMVTFFSRSKNRLWQKGEESGNSLRVVSISVDCDSDSLLIKAEPAGPTCHDGTVSCFQDVSEVNVGFLAELFSLIEERKNNLPESSYTSQLFRDGQEIILGKIKEESDEVIYAVEKETKTRLTEESADLLFHLFVLLVDQGVQLSDVISVLVKRNKKN